jgi:hypothetical protein
MDLLHQTLVTAQATLFDVLPIVLVLVFFQFAVLRRPLPRPKRILLGSLYVAVGMTLFIVGLEEALFPIGRTMARQLVDAGVPAHGAAGGPWYDYLWVYAFAAAVGFATTFAEPALIAVALKAEEVSGGTVRAGRLRFAVASGVAVGVAVGCFRIVTGTPLPVYIIAGYVLVMLQTATSRREIIPLAYDSGGVTTSTVTVPVVTALGLGLAAAIPGRSPLVDGFGLIAFASLFPIMAVLGYAWLAGRIQSARKRTRNPDAGDRSKGGDEEESER